MSEKVKSIRGMQVLLPEALEKWQAVEETVKSVFNAYAFKEIRTPIVERSELFHRTIGENTDVVSKEMYSFKDRKDQSLSLRPEATAGIVRAGIEHSLFYNQTQKLWSMGPMYRYERPQKGRYRQFHQINMEAFGFSGPEIDAEIILMTARIWKLLKVDNLQLEINSLGMPVSRKKYRTQLKNYFSDHRAILDEDSLNRLENNPMRILDSKNPDLQSIIETAPKMLDFLDTESSEHFEILKEALTANGIPFILNDKLVRGLDYYTKTVFEWTTDQLGSQATVCGGGRYDGLVQELGGQDIPAIGCAIGVERLTELVAVSNENPQNKQPKIYIVAAGKEAQSQALVLSEKIRDLDNGVSVIMNMDGGSFKQQFKRADKSGSDLALIIGEEEIESGTVAIKSMNSDTEQKSVEEAKVLDEIKQYL